VTIRRDRRKRESYLEVESIKGMDSEEQNRD
jgi:hypothetical protein